MPAQETSPKIVQFGAFELDLHRGELRKQGVKVKLQEQPLKVLQLLLDNPGEIISREQLRSHVWPANTFVEFDQSLYSAMARLRDALGDTSESPRFVETVARRGYRFIAPVAVPTFSANSPNGDIRAKTELDRQAPQLVVFRRLVTSLLAGLVGGALLLAVVLAFDLLGARSWLYSRTHPIRSIAVLPLENLSGDPAQEYFADGMTDELITTLAKLGSFRVVSRTSVMRFKKVSKPLAQVGQELNVDAVVEGTVERFGSHVRIRVQLIHADTDRHLWAQTYDRELRDTLLLQSEAARDIAQQIQFRLDSDRRPPAPTPRQVNPQAYEAYLQGLYFSNKRSAEDFTRAINYFQQAISIDPSYAAAYSGLSNALLGEMFTGTPYGNVRERATFAAMKSIELDPNLPESHDTLGGIHEFYEWDWSAAEHEYRRAIELNSNFAAAHQDYAIFLSLQGRFDQAMAEAQRAQDLDPLSPFIRTTFCWDLSFAHRFEQAAKKCREALELDADFNHAHGNLAKIYASLKDGDQAFQEYFKTAVLSGKSPSQLAQLQRSFRREGLPGVWRTKLLWLQAQDSDPYEIAALHAWLGDKEQAFTWLQKAYDRHSPHMEEANQDAAFDNVRSDQRYSALLHRLKLQ